MKRVTWVFAVLSTVALLVTMAQGMALLKGHASPISHFYWGLATLVLFLLNNLFALIHVSRGERLIQVLRAELEKPEGL